MSTLIIACGSYQGEVFAFRHEVDTDTSETKILKPVFIDTDAHNSAVNCLAIGGDTIVSGSSDEIIQVFSIRQRSRLGCLELHSGTIRQLCFAPEPNSRLCPRHLLSASDDACMAIWRHVTPNDIKQTKAATVWQCVRQLRRHKAAILSLAVHPTSRVAVSVSADKTLRVWNLARGRQAYAVRLRTLGADGTTRATFSPSGRRLLIASDDRFNVVDLLPAPADASQTPASVATTPLGNPLGHVKFPFAVTAPAVFESEDDFNGDGDAGGGTSVSLHVVVGVGPLIKAYRCPLDGSCAGRILLEAGEAKLPGRRVKCLSVLPWPVQQKHKRRLIVAVTTEPEASHVRGYLVDVTKAEWGKALTPIFLHDLTNVRITSMAADWVPFATDSPGPAVLRPDAYCGTVPKMAGMKEALTGAAGSGSSDNGEDDAEMDASSEDDEAT